jgi:hypothetical protein
VKTDVDLCKLLKELQSKFPNIISITERKYVFVIHVKDQILGGSPIEIKGKDVEYIIDN